MAKKWNMSERGVRKYCTENKIPGAFLTGKTWNIPENAEKPERINKKNIVIVFYTNLFYPQIYHNTILNITNEIHKIEQNEV